MNDLHKHLFCSCFMIEAQWVQMVVILLDQLSSLVKVLKNTFNKSHVRAIVPHYHTSATLILRIYLHAK